MKSDRRTLLALAAAIFLPLLLFVALQAASSLRAQRVELETETLLRAQETNAVIDGQLMADISALEVLAWSPQLKMHDMLSFRWHVQQVQQGRPHWKTVVLSDLRTRREIWETSAPVSGSRPLRPDVAAYMRLGGAGTTIGGISPGPPPCPCVAIHTTLFERGRPAYVLTAETGPEGYQRALVDHGNPPAGIASAVVDRNGTFLARTIDPQSMFGKPASVYVRRAALRGGGGLYRGVTLEGRDNFTAYRTSALSGWSTHIALKAGELLSPGRGALVYTFLAALVAIVFALAVSAYAFYQYREREREAARHVQSQKLEAMGQLASGVAHDFGNLLAIIVSGLRRVPQSTENAAARAAAEGALAAATRGITLTRQLLNFARTEPIKLERVDLDTLLVNLRPLVVQSLEPGMRLTIKVEPAARFIRASADLLELALLNMAVNARDAMADGGELEILAALNPEKKNWVNIRVRDTGHGMSKAVLGRVMEPFFTTKGDGKGTGLGTGQILAAVRPSGGSVDVQSKEGVGSTFTLRLPLWIQP